MLYTSLVGRRGREEGAGGMKREERERGKKRIEEKVDE